MVEAFSPVSPRDVSRATTAAFGALRGIAPAASNRAARALDIVLAAWRDTGDGAHAGRLTRAGFPLEFVCSTRDDSVRYTCDVAGPAIAPAARLPAAQVLLRRLGVNGPFPLRHLQTNSAPLRWGAWLGGRHTATSDAYKLYVEAPTVLSTDATAELRRALGQHGALLDSRVVCLRLVGVDIASGRLECYFAARGLQRDRLRGLMEFAGVSHREDALRLLLDDVAGAPGWQRLPERRHGFSISLPSAGVVDGFSLFVFARVLFGSTAMVRRGVLACADRHGWNLAAYAAVSAPLVEREEADEHHGLVSFVVAQAAPLGLAIGLRPPLPLDPAP